jgi:hypothetical protein
MSFSTTGSELRNLSGLRSVHEGPESCPLSLPGPASPLVIEAVTEHGPVLAQVMPVAGGLNGLYVL